MTPQSVGKTESTMVLGKLSGRHAFVDKLKALGYTLSKEEIDDAFVRFKDLADRKKTITEDDLEVLMSQKLADVPATYRMDSFQIQSGNKMQAMASVSLVSGSGTATEAATGDGPIDAAYNAVQRIVGGQWPLAAYDIKAVTEGRDALGEVTVRVKHGDQTHTGRGLASDIIESSILAYINAINRALAAEKGATV